MELETIITIISGSLALVGSGALFFVRMRAFKRQNDILKEEKAKEIELREREARDKFYLLTASNLVMSAERLNLTGPQKKEYVMTWLENEAIKAGIPVDKAYMSTAIERTILIMNDHRKINEPFVAVLDKDLEKAAEKERERIKKETDEAVVKAVTEYENSAQVIGESVEFGKGTLEEVKELLNKRTKK